MNKTEIQTIICMIQENYRILMKHQRHLAEKMFDIEAQLRILKAYTEKED